MDLKVFYNRNNFNELLDKIIFTGEVTFLLSFTFYL